MRQCSKEADGRPTTEATAIGVNTNSNDTVEEPNVTDFCLPVEDIEFAVEDIIPVTAIQDESIPLSPPPFETTTVFEPISQCSLPGSPHMSPSPPVCGNDYNAYGFPLECNLIQDIDVWIATVIPLKEFKRPKRNYTRTLSGPELQKLYSSNTKKALNIIQNYSDISCEMDPQSTYTQLTVQFAKTVDSGRNVEGLWTPCPNGKESLCTPFSIDEINEALNHENSAPGPDGWTYRDLGKLKNFTADFLEVLHTMAATGKTPKSWKHYKSLLLFKRPGDYRPGMEKALKNFRPIALSNVSYKLLTSMLAKRMTRWLEQNNGISFGQRAVFSRRGVKENTLIVSEALRSRKPVLYLDITDAFNSVSHDLIFTAISNCDCPEWIVNLIKSLYESCTTTPTKLNGENLCGKISIERGVRQGCPLSALLFNLVIDPLVSNGSTNKSISLGYMDDIAIIFESESEVKESLESLVNGVKAWFSFQLTKVWNLERRTVGFYQRRTGSCCYRGTCIQISGHGSLHQYGWR